MTNNISFNTLEQLIKFLNDVKELNDWETVKFRISTSNGMELNVNTYINDPLGVREFIEFRQLKLMMNNFYEQNNYLSINLEIKIKLPNNLRKSMDPNGDFKAFYLDFYSNSISNMVIPSFVENTKEIKSDPIKNWTIYVNSLYDNWYTKLKNNGYF